jgi:hypothetical protein
MKLPSQIEAIIDDLDAHRIEPSEASRRLRSYFEMIVNRQRQNEKQSSGEIASSEVVPELAAQGSRSGETPYPEDSANKR